MRRVIITGGATNIGRAITTKFLRGGARVVVGQPDVAVAASLLEEYGDKVAALQVDIGNPGQCRRFVDEAAGILGGVDVLVNNAAITGSSGFGMLRDVSPEQFERIVGVNLGGVLFCSQAAAPHMRNCGGGVIVHISSINAFRPQLGAMIYAATKAGVSSLARSMARELAGDNIRVVAVAPGDIATDASAELEVDLTKQGAGSDIIGQTPLGRGDTVDVAETVYFLCSAGAKFVTGTTWLVDGGLLA